MKSLFVLIDRFVFGLYILEFNREDLIYGTLVEFINGEDDEDDDVDEDEVEVELELKWGFELTWLRVDFVLGDFENAEADVVEGPVVDGDKFWEFGNWYWFIKKSMNKWGQYHFQELIVYKWEKKG